MSMYPDFNRGKIDTDESQQYFALSSAFVDNKYIPIVSNKRPKASDRPAYSHGGSNGTIYAMVYTFYEDIKEYQMAGLEHQRLLLERERNEKTQRLKLVDEEKQSIMKSSSDAAAGHGSKASTVASISSKFRRLKQENVNNLRRCKNLGELDYTVRPKRAVTPSQISVLTKDFFDSSSHEESSAEDKGEDSEDFALINDDTHGLFKGLERRKASPGPSGGSDKRSTSPYAAAVGGVRKPEDNFLSVLYEEVEDDDNEDSLDRSKPENKNSGSSGENP